MPLLGGAGSGPKNTLAEQRYVPAGSKLSKLATSLDALKPNRITPVCGAAAGRSVLIMFRFEHEPDDPVRFLRSGCTVVGNGHLHRYASDLPVGEHWPDEGLV